MIELFPYKDGATVAKLKLELQSFEEIDYSLVLIQNFIYKDGQLKPDFREYVCAWAPVYKDGMIDHWGQGHYFSTITGAVAYINAKKGG